MAAIPPQTLKRINRELKSIQSDLPEGILSVGPKSSANIYDWQGSVAGPSGSCYEGGVFHFSILLPYDYPFHPPRVTFVTRIFHPNIDHQGGICLDILKQKWSPALSVLKVLLSIICLLTDPNPQDPLVRETARMYLQNRSQFENTARKWVETYARPPPSSKIVKAKPNDTKQLTVGKNSSTIESQKSAVIINLIEDDEIQVIRPNQTQRPLETSTSSTKRKASEDSAPSFGCLSSSLNSTRPHNTATSSSDSTRATKRTCHQVIELD